MVGKVNLARVALILASIWNQNKKLLVEIENFVPRRVACSYYDGPFGVEAFKVFSKLHQWNQAGNVILTDRWLRPYFVGIHLNRPFEVAIGDVGFYGCVWIPNDSTAVDTSDVQIFQLLGGPHARTEQVNLYPENSWSTVYALEKQLPKLPGHFRKDPREAGWWEQYSPEHWNVMEDGRPRFLIAGFKVVRESLLPHDANSTTVEEEFEEDNFEILSKLTGMNEDGPFVMTGSN